MKMSQKALVIATVAILILSIMAGMTGMQMLPFVILGYLIYKTANGKPMNAWIIALSMFMVFINLFVGEPSWIDGVIWILFIFTYWKE
jgi:hypothetical protein